MDALKIPCSLHPGTSANHDDVAGFEKVIESAKGGMVVVLDADAAPVMGAYSYLYVSL
jgi:hypothetical protein